MKCFKFLKQVDYYNQPVSTYIPHINKQTNEKTNNTNHGTIIGGALTLVCLATIIAYSCAEINCMLQGRYDSYSLQI